MPIVQMPDGAHVQFPDEMPPDQIRALILQKFPNDGADVQPAKKGYFDDLVPEPAGAKLAPARKGYFDDLQPDLPPGFILDTPKDATFDAEGARKAGYTDAEIQGVQKALAAGYTPEEISAHLAQQPPPVSRSMNRAIPSPAPQRRSAAV